MIQMQVSACIQICLKGSDVMSQNVSHSDAREAAGQKLLKALLFTLMLSSMSAMMFNIVLPDMSEEFGLSLAQVSWISSAYSLIYAVGTVTYGKLADRFKLKNVITFGLLLFAAGSVFGLVSQTFWTALAARCLQSAGAAAIPAVAMLIPIRYFDAGRRGAALGTAAVGLALGSALGPVVSAALVSFAHWRWLFAVPVLILFTLPMYRKHLIDEPDPAAKPKFDWAGGLLLAAAAGLVLTGVTEKSWILAAAGLAFGALFAIRIHAASEPFVRPELFRNGRYTAGIAIAVMVNGIGVSLYFLTPVLLSRVQELPSHWIGFVMVPAAAASALLGRKAGKLADRKGNLHLYAVAGSSLIVCFALMSTFAAALPWLIAIFLVFGNMGQSFMLIALSNTISATLPKEQAGVGMGMFSMFNFMTHGTAAGIYGLAAELPAASSWNPMHSHPGSGTFSNIYLVLALLHVCILLLYGLRFRPAGRMEPKRAAS